MVGRKGALRKKVFRDMRDNAMQFLAMMLLCALGTWVFSGLDATWRMQETTIEGYFTSQELSDLWIKSTSGFTRAQIETLRNIQGIDLLQERITLDAELPDQGEQVSASVHANHGAYLLNQPVIRAGEMLSVGDKRGCLIEEQFATAQHLQVGDTVTLRILGNDYLYTIRGTVLEPEYLVTSNDMAPDPETYGYILVSSETFPQIPYNDLLARCSLDADLEYVQREIQDKVPGVLIITQNSHASTAQGRNYIELFKKMSYLFPALAYFVAALMVVTTISRMMDSQRLQIGTLKAMGYPIGRIRRAYLLYAIVPSTVGSAIGLYVAQFTIPQIIWRMAATNMRTPGEYLAPISKLAWGMAVMEIVLSIVICLIHIRKTERETPAELLRPKPPKSGTRIFLEHIRPFWKRCSFNTKMIFRNIARSKVRTGLCMVGMLFCNMLIICSFGLQESIPYFVSEYFFGTIQYDSRVELKSGMAGSLESYQSRLSAERIDGVMDVSVTMQSQSATRTAVITVLPEQIELLRIGDQQTVAALPNEGMWLSTKLAEAMGVSAGDTLEIWLGGEKDGLTIPVQGIASLNIGQSAYMSQTAWERLRKGDFQVTALLIKGASEETRNRLDQMDEVSIIRYPTSQYDQTMQVMQSASAAFSLLSGVALGLAFVICYNMGLLSFTERVREYATLKVLGYHQREIRSLMLKENALVAIFGVASGVIPGILLVRVILKMCEFDSMIFVPHITAPTILYSCLVTFLFTMFIELLLTRKVRKIDMVQALKSVE